MMRNHMITKIRTNGTMFMIREAVSPPVGAPWAKAGVMNKRLSMDKGATSALESRPAPYLRVSNGADYTHRLHEINEPAGFSRPRRRWTLREFRDKHPGPRFRGPP